MLAIDETKTIKPNASTITGSVHVQRYESVECYHLEGTTPVD